MGKKKKITPKARKDRRNVDALGCYKKHILDGVPVTVFTVKDMPVSLNRRFTAACHINGDTKRRVVIDFMKRYSKAVEELYNVYLDPELPDV